MELLFPKREDKCDEKAAEFRKTGNIKYQEGKLTLALLDYNKSIAFGKTKEVIALGYANRSAVYFEMKRYKDCMKNIEWALENNYPEDRAANLIDRKERCERLMQTENHYDVCEFFKLSYPPNKKIPWIVDCIELRSNLQGEHEIFATKDLKAGDIISIEEPIAPMMTAYSCYGRCYNCAKTAFLNLIPCDKIASIMFCSPKCKNESYAKAAVISYFVNGCSQIIGELIYLSDGKENLVDIIKNTNWDDPKMKKTVFDYDWNDPNDPKRKENILKCCFSTRENCVLHYLGPSHYDLVFFIARDLLNLPLNIILISLHMFISTNFHYSDILDENVIGTCRAITLFTNLINHSCTPNAIAFSADNKIVTVLLTPVKKFEQIFLIHPMEKAFHVKNEECQICNTRMVPNIDTAPIILIRDKNFTVLKAWIEYALKSINNSPVKLSDWDRLPSTFVMVIVKLGFLCAFPQ